MPDKRVYQSESGQWVYWDGEVKHPHATAEGAQGALSQGIQEDNIMAKKDAFISAYRTAVSAFLTAIDEDTVGLEYEYDALGYIESLTDEDFTGGNADLIATEFKAAVASISTLRNAFHTGNHDKKLYKLKMR